MSEERHGAHTGGARGRGPGARAAISRSRLLDAEAGRVRPHAVDFGVVVEAAGALGDHDGVEAAVASIDKARVAIRPSRVAVGDGRGIRRVAGGAIEVDAAPYGGPVGAATTGHGRAVALDEVDVGVELDH